MKILCYNMHLVQNIYVLQKMNKIMNIMYNYHNYQLVIVYLILNVLLIIKKILIHMYHLILQLI
jgi:hypothetical protein